MVEHRKFVNIHNTFFKVIIKILITLKYLFRYCLPEHKIIMLQMIKPTFGDFHFSSADSNRSEHWMTNSLVTSMSTIDIFFM